MLLGFSLAFTRQRTGRSHARSMALVGTSPDRASCAGLAAPATSEGAKAIEQGYADYFSKAVIDKGIVSVAPDGEDYVVAWDLQKALDLAGPPEGALRIERFSYTLTPTGEGAWTIKADRFPSLAFDVPTDKGKATGTFDLSGFHLDAAYDASQVEFPALARRGRFARRQVSYRRGRSRRGYRSRRNPAYPSRLAPRRPTTAQASTSLSRNP